MPKRRALYYAPNLYYASEAPDFQRRLFDILHAMRRNFAGRPWLTDCLFIFCIEVLSALPYLFKLGFYTDDWAGQSTLAQYSSLGIVAMFRAVTRMFPGMPMRPVAIAYGILEFKAFGHHAMTCTLTMLL